VAGSFAAAGCVVDGVRASRERREADGADYAASGGRRGARPSRALQAPRRGQQKVTELTVKGDGLPDTPSNVLTISAIHPRRAADMGDEVR